MSSDKIASKSSGASSPKPWVLSWQLIAVAVLLLVLMQAYFWGLLFSSTRPTALADTLYVTIAVAVAAFLLTAHATYVTYRATSVARTLGGDYWFVAVMVVYTFLLITVEFAMLYWTIGTKANFTVELSRVDAIYFALGTLTTAGTGSIAPTSDLARALVSGQMVVDLVFVAGVLTIAITRWSERSS